MSDPKLIPVADLAQAISAIRSSPLDKLSDAKWLEDDLLLRLGLHANTVDEYPASLRPWCGQGLQSWQYPNQFSKYLVFLSSIKSYLEIGCRHGGTFIITLEYLKRFNKFDKAIAIDIVDSPQMRKYLTDF